MVLYFAELQLRYPSEMEHDVKYFCLILSILLQWSNSFSLCFYIGPFAYKVRNVRYIGEQDRRTQQTETLPLSPSVPIGFKTNTFKIVGVSPIIMTYPVDFILWWQGI